MNKTSFLVFPRGSAVKNPPAVQEMQETQVRSLGQEHPLEKKMATHSSILAWEIPWKEEPGGYRTRDCRVRRMSDGALRTNMITNTIAECVIITNRLKVYQPTM